MRPKKHETTGSGDLFRARLEQIINIQPRDPSFYTNPTSE